MADRPRSGSDGVTMAPGESRGKALALLALAVILACVALLVLFGRPPSAPPPDPAAPAAAAGAASGAAAEAPPASTPNAEPPPDAPPLPRPGPAPTAPRAAEPAVEAEIAEAPPPTLPSGIGLFPPPGTDPIKIGIVVPDDFELPEGYLRHYQVTDDGQELPPILLFHPDYEVMGPNGAPLPLPADRVVPPELAPPGMPIETVTIPPPRDEGR